MTLFAPQEVLAERYVLDTVVGQGASASVWRARDKRTQKLVAIKVFKPDQIDDRFRIWLTRELKALAMLDHSSIVRMLDTSGPDVEEPWICTEWLEGADLQQLVQTRGPIPERALVGIASALLSALEAAAALTIVHRDIKPGNLFLCTSGRVVLLDFGVARATGEVAGNTLVSGAGTSIVGTPSFMSPEQVAGGAAHAASDLYSFGVTLRYLLTGILPFSGSSIMDLVKQIARGEIAPITPDRAGAETIRFLDALTAPVLEQRLQPAKRAAQEARAIGERLGGVQTALEDYVRRVFALQSEGQTTIATTPATVQVPRQSETDTLRKARSRTPLYAVGVGLVLALAIIPLWPRRKPAPPPPVIIAETAAASLPIPTLPDQKPELKHEEEKPQEIKKTHVEAPQKETLASVQIQFKQWASVEIDGIDIGRKQISSRIDLDPGPHRIVFTNPSYQKRVVDLTLKPGQSKTLSIDLAAP